MINEVRKTIEAYRLFAPGDTVVVAVSGGADSVALLDILATLKDLRLRLVVAHLNHRLRGEESDGDEAFVRRLAERYGVPLEVKAVDVKELSRQRRLSLEEAGRVARYAFFDEVATTYRADSVALAHHADDQAETILMRLLRGAAATGLCGMWPKSRNGRYVRPLLGVTKEHIEGYLRRSGLSCRVDSTNTDTNFLRNRVRHELIPYLASYNPAVTERLVATAEVLAADELLLETLTDQAFARHGATDTGKVALSGAGVREEPLGVRLRLYRRAILNVKGDLARIGFRHLTDIDRLTLSAKPHATLSLPDGVLVARSYGEVTFYLAADELPFAPCEFFLEGPGVYTLPGGGALVVEKRVSADQWEEAPRGVAYFDLDAAPFPWLVRNFRAGDRFSPLGMAGSKKVKDLFVDEKIPRDLRRRVPLLFSGENLLWVCGVRVAACARLTGMTKAVVRAEIHDVAP
ncbi:MAG: tRNA(Ile)-lysidine [Geobacteraceae bacterium]|nr:MAG: tRNA(Ile)-lysidine [Geobacteraceae bacterium]